MPLLSNPRHERFAQELAKGKSATEAAIVAEMEFRPAAEASGAYVYLLIDPRDDSVFYVGKGRGRRASSHWRAMVSGHVHNVRKHERLRAILGAGHRVSEVCLADGLTDAAAYNLEQGLIRGIGFARLTNVLPGVQTQTARDLWRVSDMIARVLHYRAWKARRVRSADDCRLYLRVWREMHRLRRALRTELAA